jgi:RNA ligase (TIGR02306 family)
MTLKTLDQGLVYVGKIICLEAIPDAHFIVSATVVCGVGGKWVGVVRKSDFCVGDLCLVYMPDALVPERDEFRFLEKDGWRVKMHRFRGVPSEVLIMPTNLRFSVGTDLTIISGVTKYYKPIPPHLQGIAKGPFPSFIPKTDEPNYQSNLDLVEALHGKPFYVTEKADGSSTTAYRYKDEFGICSRNLELERDMKNGYWKVAEKYQLEEQLREGYALQWETCGPKIQSNPMGLDAIDGFAFSGYKIDEHRYLEEEEFYDLCDELAFPTVRYVLNGHAFDKEIVHTLGEGTYDNGKQREGVVVRSKKNVGHAPISFKVINLNYEN